MSNDRNLSCPQSQTKSPCRQPYPHKNRSPNCNRIRRYLDWEYRSRTPPYDIPFMGDQNPKCYHHYSHDIFPLPLPLTMEKFSSLTWSPYNKLLIQVHQHLLCLWFTLPWVLNLPQKTTFLLMRTFLNNLFSSRMKLLWMPWTLASPLDIIFIIGHHLPPRR